MANIIVRNIPNSITCCNLISGCIATYNAFLGDIRMALLWIIVGAVFDFFDGMSARLLKVSSPIGKELDSLADDITFGFAPSAIIFYELSIMEYPSELLMLKPYLPYFAFVMAAYSALRWLSLISTSASHWASSVCQLLLTPCSGEHCL